MVRPFIKYPLAVFLFLLFLLAGLAGGQGYRLDLATMKVMAEARTGAPVLVEVASLWTMLGGAAFLLPVAGVAALLLVVRHQSVRAAVLASTVLVERALVDVLKEWVGRTRPAGGEYSLESMAFPSGHAANSMTVYLAIAIFAAPPSHRRPLVVSAILLSLTIGLTRVFLGVHWPSDVVGGWALGMIAVCLAVSAARRSGVLPVETKHQIVGGHDGTPGEGKAP